jgi:hypothetical protein
LLNRANHTGTQAISTITNLQTTLDGKADDATTLAGYGITDAAPIAHVGAGGAEHPVAIAGGDAGFMSGTDKTKLDSTTPANIPTSDEKAALVGTSTAVSV